MKRFRWTIKRKLLTLGTGAFLLALALVAVVVWAEIGERSRGELRRAGDMVASLSTGTLDLVRSSLLTFSQRESVQALDREETEQLILDLAYTLPFVEGIGVFKADGQPLSTGPARPPDAAAEAERQQAVVDRPWFRQVLEGGEPVVTGLLRGRTGQPVVLVAVPIRKGTDRPHAVVAASLNLSSWFGLFGELSLGQDLWLMVMDADGIVLAQNRGKPVVGRRLGVTFERPGLVEWEGQRLLLESAPVKGGWRVLAMLPQAMLNARAWREVRVIVFPVLAVLGVAAIVGLLIARGVWRPLQALTSRIREFGEGRPVPIRVTSTDEVGELARAFNEMSERIHQGQAALEQRAKRLAALNALAATVSGSLKLEEVLSKGLDSAIQVMGMDGGVIRLLDEAPGELVLAASRGIAGDPPLRTKPGEGFSGHVAMTEQPLFVRDTTLEPRAARLVEVFGPGAAAGVPLMAHDRVVGTMSLYGRAPHDFDKEDTETLTAIGQQVGLAVQTARLFRETERRAQETETLSSAGTAMVSTLDLPAVLETMAESASALLSAKLCVVFELDSDGQHLLPRVTRGMTLGAAPRLKLGQGAAGAAALSRRPVFSPDVREQPMPAYDERVDGAELTVREFAERIGFRAILAVPMVSKGTLLGVLAIYWEEVHPYDEREVRLLTALAQQAAVAIDNARLYEAAQASSRELAALAEAGTAMVSTLDLPAVLETIAESAVTLIGAQRCAVFELNPDDQRLYARAARGMQPELPFMPVMLGQGSAGTAALRRAPVWTSDIEQEPLPMYDEPSAETGMTLRELARRRGYRAALAVPLISKETVLGAISIFWNEVHTPDEREIRLLTALAQQAAIAIDNARLYEAIRQQASRLQGLYEVGKAISSTLEPSQVLQQIADRAADLVGGGRSAVWELSEAEQRLHVRATKGVPPDFFATIKVGQGAVGTCVLTQQPVFSPDLSTHPLPGFDEIVEDHGVPLKELLQRAGFRSILAVPLVSREQPVGALAIVWDQPHPFRKEEVEVLTAFASQAAVAMTNARLYEESVRDKAILEHSRRTLEGIHQLSVTVQESVTVRERLDQILRGSREVLGVERIGVWLPDSSGSHLTVMGGLDPLEPIGVIRIPLTPEGGALVRAFEEGREIWAAPDQALPPELRLAPPYREIPFLRTKSFGLLPLKVRDKVIGVMSVDNKVTSRPIPPESMPLLRIFAQQAAVAIENARLVENLQTTLDELKVAQEQLVRGETLRSLGEMAAGTAHHLNNLLAVVVARVQLLLRASEDPKLRQSLQIVERAALDGAGVVRRIQQFARVRAREEMAAVDLNRIAEDVLEFTRPRWQNEAQARGIKIEACLSPGPIPPISGQAAELREAVTNLVLNAVDALPQGGRIVLSSWVENGSVLLSVADNGVGMSKEAKRYAFEPFFTTKGVKSTGLGLSVAYGIVQRHGGAIALESEEGQGTTVTLRFRAMEPAPRESAPTVEPRVRAARLLVIDDEPAVLEAVGEVLKSLGHAVATAGSGPEGLALLERERYDLVLTDLGMPEMTGWQVVAAVKSRWPWIPVVLLTGWGDQLEPSDIARVDRLLQKPFLLEDVQAVLASLIPRK